MTRVRSALSPRALFAVVALLLMPAAAVNAAGSKARQFKGKTSQNQTLTFALQNGKVHALKFNMQDKCPDGHKLVIGETFKDIAVSPAGKFGGTFTQPGHPHEPTVIKGKISGNHATGSVDDTTLSQREHKLCRGHTTFSVSAK
jgi:hypothetical protein